MKTAIQKFAFVPMCTPKRGQPWFAINYTRSMAREARNDFVNDLAGEGENWESLKREGWRIVRVLMMQR